MNPHEDREILWRIQASPFSRIVAALEGQHPLTGEKKGEDFVTAELSIAIPLGRRAALIPSASGPVSSARRYEWTLAAEFAVR